MVRLTSLLRNGLIILKCKEYMIKFGVGWLSQLRIISFVTFADFHQNIVFLIWFSSVICLFQYEFMPCMFDVDCHLILIIIIESCFNIIACLLVIAYMLLRDFIFLNAGVAMYRHECNRFLMNSGFIVYFLKL